MRRVIRNSFLPGVLLCLGMASVMADSLPEEADWLRAMAFAAHQADYSGVFVYQAGGRVEVSRITHLVDQQGEYQRLEGLEGTRREIISHGERVWVYLGDKLVKYGRRPVRPSFPALLPEQMQTLKENYVVTREGEERVADHPAQRLRFQPRDNLRYARKMWAHSDSGLLLKAVVLDERDRVIEQYAFSQLQIGGDIGREWIPDGDEEAAAVASGQPCAPLPQVNGEQVSSGWQVDALPPGFRKIIEMRRTLARHPSPAVQIVYSDGLASLSIFIEQVGEGDQRRLGLSSLGAVHLYRKLLDDNYVTVVGELMPRAVVQVAESVRYAGERHE